MEILVDGNRQELAKQAKTMGRLLADVKSMIAGVGKVVVRIRIDGRELDADGEKRLAEVPTRNISTIDVETADPRDLCISTLEEVDRHIQPVIDECGRIAALFDGGQEKKAFERILPCIEVWAAILSAIQKISALMQISVADVATDKEGLPETINALVAVLSGLKQSIDAHDVVAVRDTMKHEMPDIAGRMSDQISALSAKIST